jgi:hypothetical protein
MDSALLQNLMAGTGSSSQLIGGRSAWLGPVRAGRVKCRNRSEAPAGAGASSPTNRPYALALAAMANCAVCRCRERARLLHGSAFLYKPPFGAPLSVVDRGAASLLRVAAPPIEL